MTGPTESDWILSMAQTLNAVGDPTTIKTMEFNIVRRDDSWWTEARVVYNDGTVTRVI